MAHYATSKIKTILNGLNNEMEMKIGTRNTYAK